MRCDHVSPVNRTYGTAGFPRRRRADLVSVLQLTGALTTRFPDCYLLFQGRIGARSALMGRSCCPGTESPASGSLRETHAVMFDRFGPYHRL
jgi:hypothetical protein